MAVAVVAARTSRLLCVALLAFALVASGCSATASSETQRPAEQVEYVAATPTGEAAPEVPAEIEAALTRVRVTRVVDGDTVEVEYPSGQTEKVRLIGIDTPESTKSNEPYGDYASAFAKASLDEKYVWLEEDVESYDRYGRLLAYVWTAMPTERSDAEIRAKMFNARLVIEGYAGQYTYPPNVAYAEHFGRYAAEARKANRGLWGVDGGPEAVDHSGSGSSGASTSSSTEKSDTAEQGYVANANSKKFHEADCSSVDDMNPDNKRFYASRQACIDAGYIPCKRCDP